MSRYTLVQHSGFVWGDDPQFKRAVETRSINARQEAIVRGVGGLVFDGYDSAEAEAHNTNYPDATYTGLIPMARGSFHKQIAIDDLPLFIPEPSPVAVDG